MTLKTIEHLHTLYNNPFLLEPILPTFFYALGSRPKGVLLAYLVLPLVLPVHTRKVIGGLQSSSGLLTFTAPTRSGHRELFLGLGVRVAENRELTNACLQYNIDMGTVSIGDDLNAEVTNNRIDPALSNCPQDMIKAAAKLGNIFRPHTTPMIFAELGIGNI